MARRSAKDSLQFAILGCGYMGTALLQGFLNANQTSKPTLTYVACVRSSASKERLKRDIAGREQQVELGDDITQVAKKADVILVGCQPADLEPMLETKGLVEQLKQKVIISVLAGVSSDKLIAALMIAKDRDGIQASEGDFRVARVIPSIGAKIADSVSLVADTTRLNQEEIQLVDDILEKIGVIQHVPEKLMDEATAIGAVCHALTIVANDAIIDASVAEGVPRSVAAAIAAQSLRSSNQLLTSTMTPETLKTAMSTPSGITINSVLALENGRVAISNAVREAIRYTKSMG